MNWSELYHTLEDSSRYLSEHTDGPANRLYRPLHDSIPHGCCKRFLPHHLRPKALVSIVRLVGEDEKKTLSWALHEELSESLPGELWNINGPELRCCLRNSPAKLGKTIIYIEVGCVCQNCGTRLEAAHFNSGWGRQHTATSMCLQDFLALCLVLPWNVKHPNEHTNTSKKLHIGTFNAHLPNALNGRHLAN